LYLQRVSIQYVNDLIVKKTIVLHLYVSVLYHV